jgi:hypothetical protein
MGLLYLLPEGKKQSEDLGVDGRIIRKGVLKSTI